MKSNNFKAALCVVAAAGFAFAGVASAADFDTNVLKTTAVYDQFEMQITAPVGTALTFGDNVEVTAGVNFNTPDIAMFDTNLFVYGGVSRVATADVVKLGADFDMVTGLAGFDATLALDNEYAASANDLDGGTLTMTPNVGLAYAFSGEVTAFSEVGYSFIASNEFAKAGGYAEVGLDVALTNNVAIIPTLRRSFDTAASATQAGLEVKYTF
jgi:hypothetical protein